MVIVQKSGYYNGVINYPGFLQDACVETDHAFVKKAVPAERPYLERKLEEMCDYNKAVIIVHVLMTVLLLIIYTLAGYIMWLSLAWRMIYKEKLIDSNSCVIWRISRTYHH